MKSYDAAQIENTIKTWQPYFTQPLTERDAEEIIWRWTGFIDILGRGEIHHA